MAIEIRPPEKWVHLQYHWIRDPHGKSIIYEWAADAKSWTRTGDEQDYEPDSFVDGWTYWKPCDAEAVTLDLSDEGLIEIATIAVEEAMGGHDEFDREDHRRVARAVIAAISKERGT